MVSTEKLSKVLSIVGAGTDLHDDTYIAQFMDSLAPSLQNSADVRTAVLQYCSDHCSSGDNRHKFAVELAALVVRCDPASTLQMLALVGVTEPEGEAASWTPRLLFYRQVFLSRLPSLDTVRCISQDNVFWDSFMFPVCVHLAHDNKYTTKDVQNTLAEYVKYMLTMSDINQTPKGCELKLQLEANLKQLIEAKFKTNTNCDIFDYLRVVMETNDGEPHRRFILTILNENINFDVLKNDQRFMTSSNFMYCLIKNQVCDGEKNYQELQDYLNSILMSSKHAFSTKKKLIAMVLKTGEFHNTLLEVWERFLNEPSEENTLMSQYILSCSKEIMKKMSTHKSSNVTTVLTGHKVMEQLFSLYKNHSELVNDKMMRSVTQIGRECYDVHFCGIVEVDELIQTLLSIINQRFSVDDYFKSDILAFLSVLLKNCNDFPEIDNESSSIYNTEKILSSFVTLACDQRSMYNVRDSALLCISEMFSNGVKFPFESGKLICALEKIFSIKSKVLQPSAITCVTRSIVRQVQTKSMEIICQIFPSVDLDGLTYCDVYSDEERMEMMKLASRIWFDVKRSSESKKESVCDILKNFALKSLKYDSYWDVKLHSARFWEAVLDEALDRSFAGTEMVEYLEQQHFLTGLVLGLSDYENSVKSAYFELMNTDKFRRLKLVTSFTKPTDNPEGMKLMTRKNIPSNHLCMDYDDDQVEDILEVNDKYLVKSLSVRPNKDLKPSVSHKQNDAYLERVSHSQFEKFCSEVVRHPRNDVDQTGNLNSIMEDIIQSCSGECQMDLIDCY